MSTQDTSGSATVQASSWILHRWPTLFAIALVAFIAVDGAEGAEQAEPLAAAALIYLAAATLRRPSVAWPLFAGAIVVIFATEAATGGDLDSTWVLLGLSVPLLVYGLWSRATRSYEEYQQMALAMVVFGAATALALGASEDVGAYLLAAGLLGHAVLDVYLHRADKVVVRSMTEFCFVLDTLLAVVIVAATI